MLTYETIRAIRIENAHLRDKLAELKEQNRKLIATAIHHCETMNRILDNVDHLKLFKDQAE